MALYLILFTCSSVFLISYFILTYHKLSSFNGPLLASVSDLWLFWHNTKYKREPFIDVHRKYGKVVRIGPNKLSFSSNVAIRDIYSVTKNLQKSSWYAINAPTAKGVPVLNLFASSDTKYHDDVKRMIHKYFTLETTRIYEPTIARTTDLMIAQIHDRFADKEGPDGVFDLGLWCQYFALDTISEISFGKAYGYMESDRDVIGLIENVQWFSSYCFQFGAAPWLDHLLLKNPILLWLNRLGIGESRLNAVEMGLQCQMERERDLANGGSWRPDLLDKLLQSKQHHPGQMDGMEVNKIAIAIILAGADTTAGLLGAIFRYLLKYPQVYAKLQAEVDAAPTDEEFSYSSNIGNQPRMRYLDAVIKETARICPGIRFSFERMTPPEGMTIDGVYVPGNTNVSVNPWPSQRDTVVWGDNVDAFDPERWMIDASKNQTMSQRLFLFGTGKFQCMGRYIAFREVYKVVPSILKHFSLKPVDESVDWRWQQGLMIIVKDLKVRAKSR